MSVRPIIPMRETFGAIVDARPEESLDELRPEDVRELFGRFGSILFRGFGADTESFMAFTERFCEAFSTYRGGALRWKEFDRQMIDGIPTLLTTTGHNQTFPIPMHGEMYYSSERPDVLWFRCVQAPRFAGETVLADGLEVAARLSERTRALFAGRKLLYIRELAPEDWPTSFQTHDIDEIKRLCEATGTHMEVRDDGTLQTEFRCSAFTADGRFINSILPLSLAEQAFERGDGANDPRHFSHRRFPLKVRLDDGSRIPDDMLDEIECAVKAVTFKIQWRDGDVAMVDNARVMHGRAQTVGDDRVIQVRMGTLGRGPER
ncbi:MAG TPA: TauD/TfdA family dioxygenase [Thermoanaerobaculia bacterium]|jgi:alpha-ketoglutarate-dependent taurine dioxygenase